MKDLVQRAQKKEQEAWNALYSKTVKEAYFVALKVCGKEQDAMDMVQDAFLTAYERLDSLEDPEKFQPWLNMIVANKCRDYLKKKKPALFSEYEQEDSPALDWEDERIDGLPEEQLDHQETVRLVAEMIDDLPEDQKLCVILYYRDELTVSAIAQSLQVSEGTVKSRLNYARGKIKAKVEELAKRGTKLYGLAPLPFLAWLLRGSAEAAVLPTGMAAPSIGATSSAATLGAFASSATSAGGVKALLTGTAAKITAGVLAVGLAVGGIAIHQVHKDAATVEPSDSISSESTLNSDEADPTISERELALQAYTELLQAGITETGLEINYYTYVDLDHNDVPELLVSDNAGTPNDWSIGELYAVDNGKIQCLGETNSRYDYFYLANDTYLLGRHRMGNQFFSSDESIITTLYYWNEDRTCNDPAIWINEEFEYVTREKFDYYNLMPEEAANRGVDSFIQTAEPIVLERNSYADQPIVIESEHYRVELPADWEGKYAYEIRDDFLIVYEKENYQIAMGGDLFYVFLYPSDKDISVDDPGFCSFAQLLYQCPCEVNGKAYDILMFRPNNIISADEYEEQFLELYNDWVHVRVCPAGLN